jgi:hypothetical protein
MKLDEIKQQKVQRYRLRMTQDNFENARPGMFVHKNDDSPEVDGFISAVDKDRYEMEICTFHPVDPPKNMLRAVSHSMSMDECAQLLRSITDQDPEVKEAWINLVNQ